MALEPSGDRASFLLGEPPAYRAAYTVTVTQGAHDTSGNPMAADYSWRFRTAELRMFLPLALRGF